MKTELRILVCGDRNWTESDVIWKTIAMYAHDVANLVIIEGGASGADSIAFDAATMLKLSVREFKADWKKHHKAAGPIRNKRMLEEGKPHLVLAFHRKIGASKGTKNMVNLARKAGIPTVIFPQKLIT